MRQFRTRRKAFGGWAPPGPAGELQHSPDLHMATARGEERGRGIGGFASAI